MAKSTRPKSATSYIDTAFGIIPRSKVILLEQKGVSPPFEVKAERGRDRERYVRAMKEADGEDYSTLEDLIVKALKESLEKV